MTEVGTLKESLKAICKEGETIRERYAKRMADNKTKFDAIFAQIWKIEPRGENNMNPFASTDEITEKAIEAAGLSDDNEITTAFKEHQKDYYSFYKLDKESIEIKFQIESLLHQQKQPSIKTDGWQFVSFNIIAPKQIQEEIIAPMMEADAKEGKGLFANVTQIPIEQELDEFLMIEPYIIKNSFVPYLDELKKFKVVGEEAFLCDVFTRGLFALLRECALVIQNHTDEPSKTKNYISSIIKELDKVPVWGLFIQILLLQGLCRWLESVNINEGDSGFDEAQSLYNWLCERLAEKEIQFCFVPYGDEDKQILKPLCTYLYSTDLGQMVQNTIFKSNEPQQVNNTPMIGELTLPSELDNESARKYFAKAIKVGYMERTNNGYKWLFGNNKGQARLGYFCYKVYSNPRPISKLEELFGVKKLSASITNAGVKAKRADVNQWRNEIDNNIFND